jgi:serine/threonine protein phosphatase 1
MPNRTIAIGDIHGCHVALKTLLEQLALSPGDTVIVLGDVVDRGPGTNEAIDQLLGLQRSCSLIFLMGNHEEMMLDARNGHRIEQAWLRFGGRETLESYGGGYGMIPEAHWKFLESGRDYWETEREIFIHANLEPGVELPNQTAEWLRWTRLSGNETPREGGKRVICGHTNLTNGRPWVRDGWVCIDTWCYGQKYLTALDVTNDLIYQARQTGETEGPFPLADFAEDQPNG